MYLSKKKERQLIKMYPSTENADIARILGISEWIVRKVAAENELEKQEEKGWSKNDIDMLIQWYPIHHNSIVAIELLKTKLQVEHQAFRLGLQKNKEYFGNIYSSDEERIMVKQWSDGYDSKIHGSSKGNYVLGRILDFIYPMYQVNTEEPIGGLRIDLYIKDLKIGFEYDGKQHKEFNSFHFETQYDFIKAQNRDYEKSFMCEKMGIAIVRFAHDEQLSVGLVKAKIREIL